MLLLRDILVWPVALLPLLMPVLLIAFWVVARKRVPVGAIPWILAYGALIWLMQILQGWVLEGHNLQTATDALWNKGAPPVELGGFISMLSVWLIFIGAVKMPLIVLLVLSNVAAALPNGPAESRVWRFFTGAYRWRRTLGVTLLASVVGGSFSFWSAVWYLQSLAR